MDKRKSRHFLPLAKVYYVPTGETIKAYPSLRGARIAATRFNQNAGHASYAAGPAQILAKQQPALK